MQDVYKVGVRKKKFSLTSEAMNKDDYCELLVLI